jgi:hypothetical protein
MAEILHFVQNDRRRVQNDKHGISLIATHSLVGEDRGEGEISIITLTSTLWSKVLYSTGQALSRQGRGNIF